MFLMRFHSQFSHTSFIFIILLGVIIIIIIIDLQCPTFQGTLKNTLDSIMSLKES